MLKGLEDIDTFLVQAAAIDTYEKSHLATATMRYPFDVKYYSPAR